ncbi:TPA: hypothetical protein DDW35_09175, partial [Candidatus Sumerlaeota bacterium]|nr:hypothetical protein [Candidatus Sumerlaeota bacterium]
MDNNTWMGPKMSGSRISVPTWINIMKRVLDSRSDWKMKFDVPNNVVFRNISKEDGLLLDGGEDMLEDVPFVKGTEPGARSGSVAGPSNHKSEVTESSDDGEDYEITTPATPGNAPASSMLPRM